VLGRVVNRDSIMLGRAAWCLEAGPISPRKHGSRVGRYPREAAKLSSKHAKKCVTWNLPTWGIDTGKIPYSLQGIGLPNKPYFNRFGEKTRSSRGGATRNEEEYVILSWFAVQILCLTFLLLYRLIFFDEAAEPLFR
jgi:hypothetical protein